jgi:DNA-binding protein HU-beta
MNKTELIAVVADKAGLSKKDADVAVNAVLDAIVENVTGGEKVQLVGFGTFEARTRSAKVGKNPRTGESIEIPASKIPAFKAGKAFKDTVNQ